MNMVYSGYMTTNTGYQITEKDIETTIHYLKTQNKPCTREDAVTYLEQKQDVAHMAAHKIVDDEMYKKIKHVKIDKLE
jgi:hypothetical protein